MSESSPARLAANRANAQKSTGPVTPEGKAVPPSTWSGSWSLCCAETVVLPGENADDFEAVRQNLSDEHNPQTVTEQYLIDTMATARWALQRAQRQENAVLTQRVNEAVAQCNPADEEACNDARELAMFDGSKEGALRLRYMTAQDNIFNRALRNLMSLRRLRLREEKAAETTRRQREREEQAAAKRSAPSEPKAAASPTTMTTTENWEMVRRASAESEIPAYSAPRTAPTAPAAVLMRATTGHFGENPRFRGDRGAR